MWGHILTEIATQQGFDFDFENTTDKSKILVYLSQLQYRWLFFFSLWLVLYFYIVLKIITFLINFLSGYTFEFDLDKYIYISLFLIFFVIYSNII